MSFIGNLLWIIIGGGGLIALGYLIGGLLLCLTVVGIPFGVQCVKLAILALAPFGHDVRRGPPTPGLLALFMNVLWVLVGGFWIGVVHLGFGILCAITLIGIPFAKQHAKLASLALLPFGAKVD